MTDPILRNGQEIQLTEIDENIIQLFQGTEESKLIGSKLLISDQVTPEIIERYIDDSKDYLDLEEREKLMRSLLKHYLSYEKETIEKIVLTKINNLHTKVYKLNEKIAIIEEQISKLNDELNVIKSNVTIKEKHLPDEIYALEIVPDDINDLIKKYKPKPIAEIFEDYKDLPF